MNKGQLIEAVQKKLGKDTTKAAADAAPAQERPTGMRQSPTTLP